MAEKKSWRDYTKDNSTEESTKETTTSKKTGSWRDYTNLTGSGKTSGGWRDYRTVDPTSIVGENVVNQVNSWLQNHNSYITEYQKRYEGRKYSYEDAYVGDSADWLNTAKQKKSTYDAEADAIISYLYQNRDYLDASWMQQIKSTITKARDTQNQLIVSAQKDNDYWAKFTPNEDQAAAGYTAEKLYNEWQSEQKQYAEDMAFDIYSGEVDLEILKHEKAMYLKEQEEKRKQAQENESWMDKVGRWLGTTPDTSLPLGGASAGSSSQSSTKYDSQIAALEEQIERAKYVQGYEGFMGNMDAKDYASNSQYASTRTDVAMKDAMWGFGNTQYDTSKLFGDFMYDYINRNEDALSAGMVNDTATDAYFLGFDKGFLKTMTDDEIGVYNYLYKTQGQESANAFLSHIESNLEGRRRAQEQAFWASYAKSDPVGSSVFSTLISPLKGMSYLGQAADMLDDGKMEENAGYNRFSYIPSTIRSQVSTTIEKSGKWGKVGSFAYNTGMSMADFLFTTAVSGGNQALSLSIMGSGAAADATLSAKDRGLDDAQAFTLGTIAGLAEVAMEKISLGAWLEGDMTEGALRYMLKNALSEGGEEAGTSVINLLADVIIAGDKSEWNMAMQAYIDQGKSEAEAFGLVLAENAAQIGLDALGGALSGSAIGGGTYAGASIGAGFQYGDIGKDKAQAQQLVTEGLELNPTSQYVQKAKSKLDKGKNLTGMQVRNILAANQEQVTANDMKKIQKAAEKRLTDLGQTKDVSELAEIATKWATGQEITRAEKRLLTHSEYGSRVANELLPENIASEDFSTEWAEEIGTKQVNKAAYNKKAIRNLIEAMASTEDPNAYKSLESRMEAKTPVKVSDTGKTVVRTTGDEIDLKSIKVKEISEDSVVVDVNGQTVTDSEIDFATEELGNAFNALKKVEHITPTVASDMIAKIDTSKPIWGQMNGMDEAFTYGYWNYSEADLKAGLFASNLTKEQQNDAYKLGQYVRKQDTTAKADAFKQMRTAAQALAEKNAKADGKAKNLTITYNKGNGEVVSIDEAGINDAKRSGGVEVAKILHQLGLGTRVELFSSYLSETLTDKKGNPARVFLNDQGVEQRAYSGVYRKSDGTIRIDLNAYNGRGLTLNALSHELTHFIQQWSDQKYQVLVDFLMKEYEKTDMTMHERVLREQKRLENIRGEEVSYDEAYDEVVANAMSKMFDDGKLVEKLTQLKEQDMTLAQKLWEGFKKILAKFIGIYEKEGALFKDAADLVEMKETFEQLQNMFAEALVEASENYQASLITKEAGLEFVAAEDVSQYSYSSLAEAAGFTAVENENGTRSFVRDGQAVSKVTVEDIENSPIGAFINFSLEMGDISEADATKQKKMFADICTMACKTNDFAMTMQFVGSAVFTGMKANADKQYGTTYDFPSICTKTQAVIDAMSAKMVSLGRGLNTDEIVQLYADVFASGNPVPCPECYVFSRWIGVGGLLDNIKKYQDYYGDMAVEDVAAEYRKMKAEVSKFADEQGISFGKAKGALTSKLTKEFNKLNEKIEKAQNQGEKVKPADLKRLEELEPMMNTVKGMTWLENVYFADSSLKKVNPKFRVPDSVLFDLNNGEAFASQYKDAWAFRTTQGAGYGKAITPYAEARLGEGVLVTNNTTNAIKGKAQGSLNNYFLNQMGKLDKQSRDALKRARLKQKIQAFIGGQRFQSTSDARYENASDYLLAALEMQAMGGMVQCYTKVDGAVPAFSAWGFSINQSLMPLNGGLDADGNVKDTSVGGMKPSVAFENRKNHESAGTITIGVNDNHIRAMFKQLVRDFIIPYHASGGKAEVVSAFRKIQEGKEAKGKAVRSTDYSRTQSDKILSDEVLRWQGKTDAQIQRIHEIRNARIAILIGGKPNMTVVRSNRFLSALYDKLNGGEWDGVKLAKSKVESQIFPNEFWDQTVTYEESAKITKDYLEYCEDLGFLHRFSGMVPSNGKLVPVNGYNENGERVQLTDLAYQYDENGNKSDKVEDFFWKVLTDRRMYDNNGNYLAQKVVTLNDTTTETVTGFAKNNQGREYDKAKAEALAQKIVKGEERFSLHDTVEETKDLVAFHNISEKLLWDALKQKGLVMPSLAVTNKGLDAFGEISLLFDKSVIDPAVNKDNKLYGADAWTPMQTTLKMNAKFDTNKTVNAVNTMKDHIGSKYVSELLNITPKQFKEAIIKADGNIYEAYAHNIGVQTAYAMEKGIISQVPTNKDGTVNQEMLQKQLDKTLDTDEGWRQYRRWLTNISDTVITSYDQATNEDVLRHMKSQPATAKSFKLSETGELVVPAVEYSSIKELRRNKNRLSENAEEATKAVASEFLAFAQKIGDTQQVVEAINAGFEGRYNIADIMKAFSNKGIKLSSKEAGELQSLYKKAVELPTQYFEAKPGGEVGLDKVNTAVVPDNVSAEIRQALEEQGINVIEYKQGSKESRTKAVNSVKDLMFSSQETDIDTDQKVTYHKEKTQEVIGNERREETREAFLARASKSLPEVDERGSLAFGFRRYSGQLSQNIREAEEGLKQLGIPVVVFEQLEGNKNGSTTIFRNDANAIPGVAVFVRHNATTDAAEIVGHEGYHYLYTTDSRTAYADVLNANVNFASKAFIDYQQKYVGANYFAEDVEVGSKEWTTFMEEIFAYITGDIHNGDPKGEVHKFIRDYDAVKAAWDGLIKEQSADSLYSSQETDADYITYDRTAILKESKVDEYLNDYAAWSSPKYAQAYITYMRPRDFLKLTTTGIVERFHIDEQAGKLDEERLSDSRPGIYLRIDHKTGKVVGHEGRHRMSAMGYAGVDRVPVLLVDESNNMTKTDIDRLYLHGQFDETEMSVVMDAIPLSVENRSRVIEKFATQSANQRIGEKIGYNKTLRFSEHDTDYSNRSLLANAFEGITNGSEEYKMIQEYKGHIKDLNALEKELSKLNAEIRQLRFGKDVARDPKRLQELETKAKAVAGEINRHDKKLLSLEASEPLRKVIERERKKEAQKTKAHVQEIQQNKKVRAEQTELRHKIRKTIRDLDKILNRGNKKQNVKEDMKGFASKALELADYLFTDHISNDDLIRKGITVRMTPKEAALVKETEDILSKLYDHADSLTNEEFTQLDAQRKKNLDKLRDLLTAQRNERLNTPVYNLFSDLVTEYAGLKNSKQDAVKDAYNPEVERFLRSYIGESNGETDSDRKTLLQNMRVADMTTDELWKLHNAYKMVLHSVRTANELFVKGKTETLEQKASRIMGDFANRKIPDKKVAIIARNIANKIGWDYEKLHYALDRIGSEAFTELVMNIADSENIVMQDIMEAVAFRDEMIKKYGFNNWAVNKEIDREFLDNTGKKFKLTLGQLMALYAYSRREGAWDHIEYGGFVFGEAALTNPKPADSYKLSKAQCEAITGLLTKEQKGYAEDMQKFLSETMGEKGNEVSMLLYGIKMFGEKNYFPIHVAGQFKAQANESQAKAAAGFSSMSNAGFTHAQNPNAKAPFVLEGFNEIWADHVNEMSRYHGTVPALEDMRRVMNRSFYSESGMESMAIKQLMENAFGKEAVDYFDSLYREANSGAITDKLQQKTKKLLSLFRKNSVAYSLSVVIQQPSAMSRAYAMIDKKYFGFKGVGALTSGVAKAVSSKWNPAYANAYNEMKKYAPGVTMAKEIGGFDTHTGSSIREYLLDTGKSFKQSMQTENLKGKAKAALGLVDNNAIANLPTVADKIAWIEIWNACKRETVAKHKDLAPTSEEFMQAVGERFTEVIRATQVYDSMFSKSPMLKSKNLAVQYLVSFMNEPNTTANMVEKAVRDATKGDWKSGVRTAVAVTSSIIFNNVLKAVIYAMRDDDEDETYIEKYAEAVVSGMIADFNPLSYIPYVRDVVSKLQGYDVERPDMAIVTDAIEAYQAIVKNANKDTENLTEYQLAELEKKVTDASWKLVGSVAAFFGIPVKNIYREIDGIIDHARIASANAGMTTPSSVWDKVTASIPFLESETAKADKLYEAILSGDKAYIDRLKAGYVDKNGNFDQGKYDSAVVKALRENDPRIKAAAQANVNGNAGERNRILNEIKAEGKFSASYIIDAINAETSAIRNEGKPDKVAGQYEAYDFVEAVSAGDANTAKAVREDIISTYVANGKTQTEAENAFKTDVKSSVNEAYSYGTITKATAEKMLVEYADMDEEDAADKITYWDFCKANPNCDLSESKVLDYLEFAEPAHVSLEVYEQFVNDTKDLADIKDKWGDVEVTKREQVLEVIDSLPLSWQQKDALYLAYGYAESKIWDVPW